jgi:hypothetical protein
MNLYELTGDQLRIKNDLESKGLDDETVQDTLESISGEFEDVAIAYVAVAREKLAEAEAIKNESKRMDRRAEVLENGAQYLLDTVKSSMQAIGRNKIDSLLFKISLAKTNGSLKIDDESLIPAEYWTQPETPAPAVNKILAKKAISDGVKVPGCSVESGVRLSIK